MQNVAATSNKRSMKNDHWKPRKSPSHNHDSTAPRQHPLIYTGVGPIHPVHGPLRSPATEAICLKGFTFSPFWQWCITIVRIVKSIAFICLLLVSPNHFQLCFGQSNNKTVRSAGFFMGDSVTVNTVVHTESEACQKQWLEALCAQIL